MSGHKKGSQVIGARGLVSAEAVRTLLADHLVALFTLELWCRLHLDGESPGVIADRLRSGMAAGPGA